MTIQALYTAATGMEATQTNLDVIANNLANAGTTGFKESRLNFADLCYQNYQLPGSLDSNGQPVPIGMQIGTGVRTNGTEIDQTQGSFTQTNGNLDMAISGLGFFQIQDPQTGLTLYTRAGNFAINSNGQVVLSSPDIGRYLQPALTIPPGATNITITSDGVVSVTEPPATTSTNIGQIQLANFINPQGLVAVGQTLFQASDASGSPQVGNPGVEGRGLLQQGYLEQSNTDPVNSLVNLIQTQRTFELDSNVVSASDQMLQLLTSLRRF
jgi:flagellar basal-body rod protein FlgG